MERFKRSVVFWVLLLVSVALPVAAQKAQKKQLYATNIATPSGAGIGTASLLISTSNPEYMVRTFNFTGATRVALSRADGTWPGEIVLCENGSAAGDCTYDASGNLDIEGVIVGPMFPAGVTGGMFINALSGGQLMISVNNGAGTGIFLRLI